MTLQQFPAKFDKYILLDRLASGGMAEVFRAKIHGAEGLQRIIAIKCILPQYMEDTVFSNMFKDEAWLAAQLQHSHIVTIYEFGRVGQRLYIAMELIHGHDLRHLLSMSRNQKRRLPLPFVAYLIGSVASGLDYAHHLKSSTGQPLNIIHRDISPQNILISYDGQIKIVDFGIAKATARATETQAGILKGKFAYMSPEQIAGTELDARCDIFALGSLLYESLTCTALFSAENDMALLEKIRNVKIPALHDVLDKDQHAVIPILQKALAKKPNQRYQSAAQLAEQLQRFQIVENQGIYGARQAAELMQSYYANDISIRDKKLKEYTSIGLAHCLVNLGEANDTDAKSYFQNFTQKNLESPDLHKKPSSSTVLSEKRSLSKESRDEERGSQPSYRKTIGYRMQTPVVHHYTQSRLRALYAAIFIFLTIGLGLGGTVLWLQPQVRVKVQQQLTQQWQSIAQSFSSNANEVLYANTPTNSTANPSQPTTSPERSADTAADP